MDPELRDERNQRWDEPFGKEPLGEEAIARVLALPAFSGINAGDFPDWLPLDRIIANDGRIRRFDRGEVIIRKGDYGNSLFAILEGKVIGLSSPSAGAGYVKPGSRSRKSWSRSLAQLLARRKPAEYRKTRRKAGARWKPNSPQASDLGELGKVDIATLEEHDSAFTLQAPEMFGELAALTRSLRSASVFAFEDDTVLFELRWQGLRDIRNWSEPFRQRIDTLYHERGLLTRLQECPVFDHVSRDKLNEIARQSLFETYGNFDWTHRFKREIARQAGTGHVIEHEPLICEQGNHLDGLLLINSGFARVSERVDHGERTISHLSRNDTFGLDEIAATENGGGGMTLDVSLRAIGYVDVIRIPTSLIRTHVLPGLPRKFLKKDLSADVKGRKEEMRQGMMDFVVDHRFINGENAMVINLDRCVGCDDCVRACATAHDYNPRFVRHGYSFENAMIANACMHCTDPVCLIGCPTGAIHRTENTGVVVIDDSICIGCATCANSCPYNNIRMVDIRDDTGALVRDNDGEVISRATKCDFCSDQLTGPACVQACPHDALTRTNIRDTEKLLQWLG